MEGAGGPKTHLQAHTVQTPRAAGGRLFRKYAAALASVVCLALVFNGLVDIWFSYQEQRDLLGRIQQGQAEAAAANISQFVREIENQMAWATLAPWSADSQEQWRFDAVRLLRQVPALTEITQVNGDGRELFRMSRHANDVIASWADHSNSPAFIEAMANKVYYGPVYFVAGSEPYMTLALAGTRHAHGVIIGQVNLKFIWDVISEIKIGAHGLAYVVDARSRLIAHPDISLVLRNEDVSGLPQVQAARSSAAVLGRAVDAVDLRNRRVLSAYAAVAPLNWLVFVDLPIDEAYAPLYRSISRASALLLGALALAIAAGVLLARRMMVPIRALHDGAARIGSGELAYRISIKTEDELQTLGDQFNDMATRLEESYATLERQVQERTRQLEIANQSKSRFLAAASHDLRQPLHALGLFVGQLRNRMGVDERKRIVSRIEMALAAMNELFNALLDISRLDAGALTSNLSEFPVERLLKRVETTFADAAREKGLDLRIAPCRAWVRTDFILLERIVFNLVSNAIRYTDQGRLLVGCRRRGDRLQFDVWDTGPGIPADQQQSIFGEFYRIAGGNGEGKAGLGLGLAIVDRLCKLLDHPILLRSAPGRGSCFSVAIPQAQPAKPALPLTPLASARAIGASDKLVLVIDDDPLVLDGMGGLLRSWGCQVLTAGTDSAARHGVANSKRPPDLIVSDYHLPGGKLGIDVIEDLRSALAVNVPAFLMSGDTDAECVRRAGVSGLHLLHKPVDPMALRAIVTKVLGSQSHVASH